VRPWQLWTLDGKPAEDTLEIVSQLESVLRSYPDHVGANHYYIHAVEASPNPERALPSAQRLQTLVPDAGHLVHMPAHIYQRTGDFDKAAAANIAAIRVDRGYMQRSGTEGTIYDMMYFTHNLHFLVMACSMQGNSKCAIETVNDMANHVAPGVKDMPMLEGFASWQPLTLARFQRWDDVLALPAAGPSQTIHAGAWHYARGLAFLAKGQIAKAQEERRALVAIIEKVPKDAPYGLNQVKTVMKVAIDVLDGKIVAAQGNQSAALDYYRKAIAQQDKLAYNEPQDWYYPVRETLGAALLQSGDVAGAEAVFREDLKQNPRNGRSLYGLSKALEAQKKNTDAAWVQKQFEAAWAQADIQPNLAEY